MGELSSEEEPIGKIVISNTQADLVNGTKQADFLEDEGIERMEWPANWSDLNLI